MIEIKEQCKMCQGKGMVIEYVPCCIGTIASLGIWLLFGLFTGWRAWQTKCLDCWGTGKMVVARYSSRKINPTNLNHR